MIKMYRFVLQLPENLYLKSKKIEHITNHVTDSREIQLTTFYHLL